MLVYWSTNVGLFENDFFFLYGFFFFFFVPQPRGLRPKREPIYTQEGSPLKWEKGPHKLENAHKWENSLLSKREPTYTRKGSPLKWEGGVHKQEESSHKWEKSLYKREEVTYPWFKPQAVR